MLLDYYLYKKYHKGDRNYKNPIVSSLFETETGRACLSFVVGMAASTLFYQQCEGVDCVKFKGPIIDQIQGSVYVYNEDECLHNKMVPVECDITKRILPLSEKDPETPVQKNATFPDKIIPPTKFNPQLVNHRKQQQHEHQQPSESLLAQ